MGVRPISTKLSAASSYIDGYVKKAGAALDGAKTYP
jgi:hypothetical protein